MFEERINNRDILVMPTFHPEELKMPYRMFLDSNVEKSYCFRQDIRKAKDILEHGFSRPEERFNLNPTLEDVRKFVDDSLEKNYLLGTDIEAIGLNIEYAPIICIGFAWTDSDCIVIPFEKEDRQEYWSSKDKILVIQELNRLFQKGRFLFQNGIGYDVPLLRQRGFDFPLKSFTDDTMLLHHSLNPELPHNIGFISSFYGQQPYWKHEFLIKDMPIFKMDQEQMKRYNARDCVALHQIYWPMKRELEAKKLEDVYKLAMDLCPAVIEMQENGLKIDPNKLKSWQSFLNKEINKTFEELQKIKKLPQDFNYTSGDHLTYLFYGIKSQQFSKLEDLKLYDRHWTYGYRCSECNRKINLKLHYKEKENSQIRHNCPKCKQEKIFNRTDDPRKQAKPKSKTSENYKKLQTLFNVSKIKHFTPPTKFSIPTTKSGYATDKVAITKYIISINKRLEELEFLKRRTEKHKEEDKELRKCLKFLVTYQSYSALLKQKAAFYSFKTWQDGRVRPKMLIQGTSTGRFSCKSPNLQQMPAHGIGSKMRDVFSAGEGKTLLSIDYSNLEVQVGARFMDDKVLIDMLEKKWKDKDGNEHIGLNMHDENTKTFFKVDKKSSMWKAYRDAAKKIMFARLLYGGSDNGIYMKVMTDVPECGLTLKQFKEAVNNYQDDHPAYPLWVDKMTKLAHTDRISINAFGRKRYLYGDISKIERQALNTPIQGSAADVMNETIVLIYHALKEANLKSKLAVAVHDEVILECINSELKQVYDIVSKIMTRKLTIGKHEFSIPIDAEIGKYWGSLGGFNPETMEVTSGSKH